MDIRRTGIRLPAARYKGRQTVLVTICCEIRKPARTGSVGRGVVDSLVNIATRHSYLARAYLAMRDHLQLFVEGGELACNLRRFVSVFKQITAFYYPRKNSGKLWQGRYYNYVLRKTEEIEKVAWYLWLNPVRKGLCEAP